MYGLHLVAHPQGPWGSDRVEDWRPLNHSCDPNAWFAEGGGLGESLSYGQGHSRGGSYSLEASREQQPAAFLPDPGVLPLSPVL